MLKRRLGWWNSPALILSLLLLGWGPVPFSRAETVPFLHGEGSTQPAPNAFSNQSGPNQRRLCVTALKTLSVIEAKLVATSPENLSIQEIVDLAQSIQTLEGTIARQCPPDSTPTKSSQNAVSTPDLADPVPLFNPVETLEADTAEPQDLSST